MAQDPNDMSGQRARDAGESQAMQRARQRTLEGDAPPTAAEIGKSIAEALARSANKPVEPQRLGEVVRASCRVGLKTDLRPKSHRFLASETADNRDWDVLHGKSVRLKRDAFIRLAEAGIVVIAE